MSEIIDGSKLPAATLFICTQI